VKFALLAILASLCAMSSGSRAQDAVRLFAAGSLRAVTSSPDGPDSP
jgi:hypothetical protein